MNIFSEQGYCQDYAKADCRVFSLTNCSNKARYRLIMDDGNTFDVCGTHLRQYVDKDSITKEIIKTYGGISKIIDLKTNKVVYKT